jgi:hypothetical protein
MGILDIFTSDSAKDKQKKLSRQQKAQIKKLQKQSKSYVKQAQAATSKAKASAAASAKKLAAAQKTATAQQKAQQTQFSQQIAQSQTDFEALLSKQQETHAEALAAAVPVPEAPPLDPDVALQQLKGVRVSRRKGRRNKGGISGLILSSLGGAGGTLGGGTLGG